MFKITLLDYHYSFMAEYNIIHYLTTFLYAMKIEEPQWIASVFCEFYLHRYSATKY